jgi:hypothetical protein
MSCYSSRVSNYQGNESFQETIPTDVYDKQHPIFVPTPYRYNVQRRKQGDATCPQAIVTMIRDIQTANLLQERIHSSTWPQPPMLFKL